MVHVVSSENCKSIQLKLSRKMMHGLKLFIFTDVRVTEDLAVQTSVIF